MPRFLLYIIVPWGIGGISFKTMRILRFICGGCLLLALASCGGDSGGGSGVPTPPTPTPTSTPVSGVSLNKTSLTIVEGNTETVTATVTPSTALNKSVTWTSSDSNIASVDGEGKIPASLSETLAVTRAWNEATTRAEENISILGSLRELDLSNNDITGSIPNEIGNLTGLNNLDLSSNNLTGGLPSTIINLTNLETLSVENNQLSEEVSSDILNSGMWKNLKSEPDLTQQGGTTLNPSPSKTSSSGGIEGYGEENQGWGD